MIPVHRDLDCERLRGDCQTCVRQPIKHHLIADSHPIRACATHESIRYSHALGYGSITVAGHVSMSNTHAGMINFMLLADSGCYSNRSPAEVQDAGPGMGPVGEWLQRAQPCQTTLARTKGPMVEPMTGAPSAMGCSNARRSARTASHLIDFASQSAAVRSPRGVQGLKRLSLRTHLHHRSSSLLATQTASGSSRICSSTRREPNDAFAVFVGERRVRRVGFWTHHRSLAVRARRGCLMARSPPKCPRCGACVDPQGQTHCYQCGGLL